MERNTTYSTKDYDIHIVEPNGENVNFPYILCVPKNMGDCSTLYLETNNEEEPRDLEQSAENTVKNILQMMNGSAIKSPILVPVLPTNGTGSRPYFQQLSAECIDDNLPDGQKRIDEQLVNAIEEAKTKVRDITGKKLEDKIFMHGYSASGVFAQRFAMIHPELIGELCVGGAIGSIPMPMGDYNGIKLDYPVGTNNYKDLFGKDFDMDAYKKIKFRYYVAELEDKRLTESRLDENGSPVPMHDMSYMDRSIPSEVGKNLRDAFGINMIDRCRNQLKEYKAMGIDVSAHEPYKGVMHNEIGGLAFKYIDDCKNEYENVISMEK